MAQLKEPPQPGQETQPPPSSLPAAPDREESPSLPRPDSKAEGIILQEAQADSHSGPDGKPQIPPQETQIPSEPHEPPKLIESLREGLGDWMRESLTSSTIGQAFLTARKQTAEGQPPASPDVAQMDKQPQPNTFFQRLRGLFSKKPLPVGT